MPTIFYDHDADLQFLQDRTVAIVGYGSQGHAHALNLRDSGVDVVVALPPESASRARAQAEGLPVAASVAEAAKAAQVIMLLAPDTAQPEIYRRQVEGNLEPGDTLMFAHGFNLRYGQIEAPPQVDVSLVAPKAPGHRVREVFRAGGGTPGLLAVAQDATGLAKSRALAYAKALGCTRAGVIETTFEEETETDLFGEQAVLCGGVSGLVQAAFETLVDAGYQPEVAYFECLHELKLIVDLIYEGGLSYMFYSVSDTAEDGGYEGARRLITPQLRQELRALLGDVQDGSYAKRWIEENRHGQPQLLARRRQLQKHPIEVLGSTLRSRMPFLEARSIPSEADDKAAVGLDENLALAEI